MVGSPHRCAATRGAPTPHRRSGIPGMGGRPSGPGLHCRHSRLSSGSYAWIGSKGGSDVQDEPALHEANPLSAPVVGCRPLGLTPSRTPHHRATERRRHPLPAPLAGPHVDREPEPLHHPSQPDALVGGEPEDPGSPPFIHQQRVDSALDPDRAAGAYLLRRPDLWTPGLMLLREPVRLPGPATARRPRLPVVGLECLPEKVDSHRDPSVTDGWDESLDARRAVASPWSQSWSQTA